MSSPLNFGGERTLATWLGAGFPALTWCSDSDHRRAAVWGRDAGGRAKVWAARWWDGCMADIVVYGEGGQVANRRRFLWPSCLEHDDVPWPSLPAPRDEVVARPVSLASLDGGLRVTRTVRLEDMKMAIAEGAKSR